MLFHKDIFHMITVVDQHPPHLTTQHNTHINNNNNKTPPSILPLFRVSKPAKTNLSAFNCPIFIVSYFYHY
ncbi:hypothetical protein QVD17_27273 [Tagetes erecta]|uniref:Uncharacterized protein n=1 Tax=Tagetes erecta TaxID=13708 RepID=A0AAD8K859_TARER|nr:hypothetical protein QVD17_27273 [Tagetes erecta]